MTPAEVIKEQILTLEKALNERLPNFPTVLRTIYNNLKTDAELVTFLSPEDVNIIVQGLEHQKNITLASTAMGSKKKPASQLTLDDL